jgi:hypothetical protein
VCGGKTPSEHSRRLGQIAAHRNRHVMVDLVVRFVDRLETARVENDV